MRNKDRTQLSANEALGEMTAGRLTSRALVDSLLKHVRLRDRDVGAFAHLESAKVCAAADAADQTREAALASGRPLGPLHGIPVAIKDIIDTVDYPTENGTSAFAGRQPQQDAFIVTQLKAAGALIFGKTVTTELAFFGPGKTKNPHNPLHTPGGSSSGSAAAVADFQVPLAIGTQTAGSLIRPASFCGTIGFKPSFGFVSRTGVLPQSAPLDTIGGYARTVADIALLIDCISRFDFADRDMIPGVRTPLCTALHEVQMRPPRFAFVKSPAWPQAEADARRAYEKFAARFGAHAEVVDTELPADFDGSLRLQQIVQFSDIAKNYGAIADANPSLISQKLKDIIAEGRSFSSADYAAARAEREPLYDLLRPILVNYDAILTPAASGTALEGLESTGTPAFNALWTYLGMPCISLPLLKIDGMPLGVQVVGARGEDGKLLRVADWLMAQFSPAK